MDSKPFYTSKTFWVNVFIVVFSILEGTGAIDAMPADTAIWEYAALAVGVINLVLRLVTRQPLRLRP